MAVQWKKKASQRTQMGKACQVYKSLIGTKSLALISSPEPLDPPAFNYDNLIGSIWMPEPQGYDKREGFTSLVEVRDPYGTSPAGDNNGGSYDKR
jgi:hypothetical protein